MPYRARPIRWDLLVQPTMQGLAIEAQADANMNQSILAGLLGVGRGIQQGAANKENKRRYEQDTAESNRRFGLQDQRAQAGLDLRQREFDLRVQEYQRKADMESEQQANNAHFLNQIEASGASLLQNPDDPVAREKFGKAAGALGGTAQAAEKVVSRLDHDVGVIKPQVDENGQPCGPSG